MNVARRSRILPSGLDRTPAVAQAQSPVARSGPSTTLPRQAGVNQRVRGRRGPCALDTCGPLQEKWGLSLPSLSSSPLPSKRLQAIQGSLYVVAVGKYIRGNIPKAGRGLREERTRISQPSGRGGRYLVRPCRSGNQSSLSFTWTGGFGLR